MESRVVEQIKKIDDYYDHKEPVPCIEAVKTVELVSDISIENEKAFISRITNLTTEDTTCYEILQLSYRTIRAVFLTQYKITHSYHQFLDSIGEEVLDSPLINEMNRRVVDSIGKSAKVFKRSNRLSR